MKKIIIGILILLVCVGVYYFVIYFKDKDHQVYYKAPSSQDWKILTIEEKNRLEACDGTTAEECLNYWINKNTSLKKKDLKLYLDNTTVNGAIKYYYYKYEINLDGVDFCNLPHISEKYGESCEATIIEQNNIFSLTNFSGVLEKYKIKIDQKEATVIMGGNSTCSKVKPKLISGDGFNAALSSFSKTASLFYSGSSYSDTAEYICSVDAITGDLYIFQHLNDFDLFDPLDP